MAPAGEGLHRMENLEPMKMPMGLVMLAAALAGSLPALGCMSSTSTTPAFSDAWEIDLRRHEPPPDPPDPIVIGDPDSAAKAEIYTDERGRPQFSVGDRGSVSADVDVDRGGGGAMLKYKRSWGKRTDMPSIPRNAEPASPEAPSPAR